MNILKMYPVRHDQTAGRVIDGEAVMILSDNSEVNVLNPVGTRIFELTDGQHTVADMVESIVSDFDVAPEQAEKDTLEFLNLMIDRQVFTLSETEEASS